MSGARGPDAMHEEPMDDRVTFRSTTPLLEKLDRWVEEGRYSSRAVAIREAIRRHQPEEDD